MNKGKKAQSKSRRQSPVQLAEQLADSRQTGAEEDLLEQLAIRISDPGSKKTSMPSHQSLSSAVPQAAASKNRPEGQ